MRKKILIHTLFYQNYNYGGMLQAYALYNTLSLKGYECFELLYSQKIKNPLLRMFFRSFRIIEILEHPCIWYRNKRNNKINLFKKYTEIVGDDLIKIVFEKFINKEFKTTKLYYPNSIKELEGQFDYLIVGGDQVWNPEWIDKNFFFAFSKQGKKIGYSCSAGAKEKFKLYYRLKLIKNVNKMDIISVREKSLSNFFNKYGIKNKVIADPVFLFNKKSWIEFSADIYNLPKQYIFAYLIGESEDSRININKFSEITKMPIVFIPYIYRRFYEFDKEFAGIEIYDAGPREFISLINNASLVITDSFHGTALSLILEKDFYCYSRIKDGDARLDSILNQYDVQYRKLASVDKLLTMDLNAVQTIDYHSKQKITEKNRIDAFDFLNENLL